MSAATVNVASADVTTERLTQAINSDRPTLVMFFMAGSQFSDSATTESMLEAFKTVCGGNVTVVG